MARKKIIKAKKLNNHNNKKFNIKNEFNLSLRYLKESDNYIAVTFTIFIFLFIMGFLLPYYASQESLQPILDIVKSYIKELLRNTEGLGALGMFWFIFKNNLTVAFTSIFSGVFFGIIPAIFLLSNGSLIGFISSLAFSSPNGGSQIFLRLLPHGIFEIPAIIISFALGIKFGTFAFKKEPKKAFKKYLINSTRVFVFVIIPLLFIAAIIEAFLIVFVG